GTALLGLFLTRSVAALVDARACRRSGLVLSTCVLRSRLPSVALLLGLRSVRRCARGHSALGRRRRRRRRGGVRSWLLGLRGVDRSTATWLRQAGHLDRAARPGSAHAERDHPRGHAGEDRTASTRGL